MLKKQTSLSLVILLLIGAGTARADTLNPYTDAAVAGLSTVSLSHVRWGSVGTGVDPNTVLGTFTNATAATGALALKTPGAFPGGSDSSTELVNFLNDGGLVRFAEVLWDGDGTNDDDNVNFTSGVFDIASHGIIGTAVGDGSYSFVEKVNAPDTRVPNSTTGFFQLAAPITGDIVVSLKGAKEIALFLLTDLVDATHLYFDTSALRNGNEKKPGTPALSHISLLSFEGERVPEPNQIVGLLSMGLSAALIFWVRTNRKKTV